ALGFATQSAFADTNSDGATGLITFNGKIVDATCTVEGDKGNADITVNLPTVSKSLLDTQGKTAGDTTFKIHLKNCTGLDSVTEAKAYFYNGDNVTADGRLENKATQSKANNVTVQLLTMSGTPINPIKEANEQGADFYTLSKSGSTGTGTLIYKARYYAEDTVSAGTVLAKVKYLINYN
ncbi:type 1 fimbrial protein, partial [Avibacterium paragallinarum]